MHQSSNSAGDEADLLTAASLTVSLSAAGFSSTAALSPFYNHTPIPYAFTKNSSTTIHF